MIENIKEMITQCIARQELANKTYEQQLSTFISHNISLKHGNSKLWMNAQIIKVKINYHSAMLLEHFHSLKQILDEIEEKEI